MDYALTLLLPILGGLFLGMWLTSQFGVSPIWTVILAILGMVGGIGIMYKRYSYPELHGGQPVKKFKEQKRESSSKDGMNYRDIYKVLDEDEYEYKEDDDKPLL